MQCPQFPANHKWLSVTHSVNYTYCNNSTPAPTPLFSNVLIPLDLARSTAKRCHSKGDRAHEVRLSRLKEVASMAVRATNAYNIHDLIRTP
jgi:hypothetical protein